MKHQTMRESAKFLSGLVLGDLLCWIWMAAYGILPLDFLGITWTSSMITPGIVLDVAIFLILVHYGWNLGKIPALRERFYMLLAGVIFGVVALIHLLRLFTGAVTINLFGLMVPLWLSWIGVALAAYLSYMSFRFAARLPKR